MSGSRDTQAAVARHAMNNATNARLNLSRRPIALPLPSLYTFVFSQLSRDNPVMSSAKVLFGFHAVGVRLKTAPRSIIEIYADPSRKDARMRQFLARVGEAGVRVIEADGMRLAKLAGSHGHQGVAARVEALPTAHSLDDLLDQIKEPPLLLVLDGVTDPHNLGACLRVADGAGAHAVIAPKD